MRKTKNMKTIIYFLFWIPAFAGMTMLISCSDNSVNPPNNGGPPATNDSLLFSKDSLVLRSTDTSSLHFHCLGIPSFDTCRIEFTGLTNIDSAKGLFEVWCYTADDSVNIIGHSYYLVFWSFGITDFNRLHSHGSPASFNPFYVQFGLKINTSFTNESKYIILKNIKIYRVKT